MPLGKFTLIDDCTLILLLSLSAPCGYVDIELLLVAIRSLRMTKLNFLNNYIVLQLNESVDINLYDCTNIDITVLEALHARLVLYQTTSSTYHIVNDVMEQVGSHPVHYCAWVNDRVLNHCNYENGINSAHRDELNEHLCGTNINDRKCRPLNLCPHV